VDISRHPLLRNFLADVLQSLERPTFAGLRIRSVREGTMTHSKNAPKKKIARKDDEKPIGYKSSGGRMGAGKSGKENLGSEKPTDDETMGSQKSAGGSKTQKGRTKS
jgi:hypothetical protein